MIDIMIEEDIHGNTYSISQIYLVDEAMEILEEIMQMDQ